MIRPAQCNEEMLTSFGSAPAVLTRTKGRMFSVFAVTCSKYLFFAFTVSVGMYFSVPSNAANFQPVTVLTYEDNRVLVHTPKKYHDLVTLARRKFGLENNQTITFETASLEDCNGRFVEIDESAWSFVHPFLPVICITAADSASNNSRMDEAVASTPCARRRIAERMRGDQHKNGYLIKSEAESEDESEVECVLRGKDDTSSLNVANGAGGPAVGKNLGSPQEGSDNLSFLENDDDYSADATFTLSNFARNRKRDCDVKPETRQAALHEPQPINCGRTGDSHRNENPVATKEERNFAVEDTIGPNTQLPEPLVHQPEGPALQEGDRFLVEVVHIPSGQQAMFKTRSEHRVEKVLTGVCKFFRLELEKSNLLLLESRDGQFTGKRLLAKTDSMGDCNVVQGARLLVRVDS